MEAAHNGNVATIKLLLSRGALVDGLPASPATPLMAAARDGQLDAARVLIEAGAEINRENLKRHSTALDFAVQYGHYGIAALLRTHGGMRLQNEQVDWSGEPDKVQVQVLENAVGPVLPVFFSRVVDDDNEIRLRIATVAPRRVQKLLFTTGLAQLSGFELAICLAADWPLSSDSLKIPTYDWPVGLLFSMSSAIASGTSVRHGVMFAADAPALGKCALPPGTVVVASRLDAVSAVPQARRFAAEMLLLHAVKPTAKGPTPAWALAVADKKAKAKWPAVVHRMPPAAA